VRPAIFLDRDNTLIDNDGDLGDPAKVKLRAGVPEGLRKLRSAGYNLIVVTNQGGVARGDFTEADVDAVHQRIAELVDQAVDERGLIDRFYYCPYHPEGTLTEYQREHPWRKPQPGMLLQAARDLELDLQGSWMIGDQQRDIAAGRSAGCRTVLLTQDAGLAEQVKPTTTRSKPESAAASGTVRSPASAAHAAGAAPQRKVEAVELSHVHRALQDLAEELRMARARRGEFTTVRMAATGCQLLVLLLALLGLLQLEQAELFMKWMAGAVLLQLLTVALLLMDPRT
jgi:D,D-heptose 1,7-bisphosphate phosphatase